MSPRITITEEGRSGTMPSKKPPVSPRIDLQDVLIVTGIISGEIAALVIWWPAALILLCCLSFAFAWLIQRANSNGLNDKTHRGNTRS
jgi:hypothetical protein